MAANQKPKANTSQVVVLASSIAILGGLVAVVEPIAMKIILIAGQVALAVWIGYNLRKK